MGTMTPLVLILGLFQQRGPLQGRPVQVSPVQGSPAQGSRDQVSRDERDLRHPMPIPNAFQTYENAIPYIIGGQPVYTHQPLYMSEEAQQKLTSDIVRAVDLSQDALVGLRKGLHQIYEQPATTLSPYPEPFAKNHQLLGKLLLASGDLHMARGQVKEAAADYTDLLRYGNHLVNSGLGTCPLVGINLMEHARGSLWRLSPRMTYDQLADAASLLRQFSVSQRPFPALLAKEERMLLFKLADLSKAPNFLFAVYEHLGLDAFHSPPDLPPDKLKPLTRLQVRDDCIAFFDGWIERTGKPFAQRGKEPSYEEIASRRDALLSYMAHHGFMVPATNDVYWYAFLRNQAANGLAAGAFATRAYLKREGKMPKAFADFGPSLLASLPPDPFSEGGKIQAVFEADIATFRSLGTAMEAGAPDHSVMPSAHPDVRAEIKMPGPLVWSVRGH